MSPNDPHAVMTILLHAPVSGMIFKKSLTTNFHL